MDFQQYQTESAQFKAKDLDPTTEIAVWTLGLAGESGEVADMIKKHLGHGHPLDTMALAKELGDVLWYLSQICDYYDLNLEAIAVGNINKLNKRYPYGFSTEASINRTA